MAIFLSQNYTAKDSYEVLHSASKEQNSPRVTKSNCTDEYQPKRSSSEKRKAYQSVPPRERHNVLVGEAHSIEDCTDVGGVCTGERKQ